MLPEFTQRHFGIVTQVYPPDPAAVGQHLADVAQELSRMGHRVTVITSNRGYDDPSQRYSLRECQGKITVLRLPFCSFGKHSIALRILGGISLLSQASMILVADPRITDLLLSTIPHLAGALGVACSAIRNLPFHYWLMDLNPDQIVAIGKMKSNSVAVRMFDMLNRSILRRAKTIITLDEAMAKRFAAKAPVKHSRTIEIVPPWPSQEADSPIAHEDNAFRIKHQLAHKRLIMHSGNHSAVHPLSTLLDAIEGNPLPNLCFAFVGGGVGKVAVEQWAAAANPANVLLLPYEPRETVHMLLSAADVHVVSVGNHTVGIVHPSKTYGALAAGRPLLVFGPGDSPAARLVHEHNVGWHVEHGDVEGTRRCLARINEISEKELDALRNRAFDLGRRHYSRTSGIGAVCAYVLGNRSTNRR